MDDLAQEGEGVLVGDDLHAGHEFRLDVASVERVAVHNQGGVVKVDPLARAGRAGAACGLFGGFVVAVGEGTEEQARVGVRAQECLVPLVGGVQFGAVEVEVVGEGFGRDEIARFGRGFAGHQFDEPCVQAALRFDAVFVERIDIGLDDNDFQRVVGFLVGGVADFRAEDGDNDHGGCGDAVAEASAALAAVQQQEEQPVAEQDPERTAQGARDFIPLDEPGGGGEGVAEAEPGPGDFNVEVDVFPREPGDGEKEQRQGVSSERVLFPAADDAADGAEDGEDGGHLEGVEQQGCDGTGRRYEPDPEGREGIEEQEGRVVVPEGVPDLVFAQHAVEEEEGNEADEGDEAEAGDQEGNAHQQAEAGCEEPGGAPDFRVGLYGFFFHFRWNVLQI